VLYLSPFLYILEKCLKNLQIPISIISFIDDGLFISQDKSLKMSNARLFCSYNIMSILLKKFGLVVEYSKTEIFHFSRAQGPFNPPPLDLSMIEKPILSPKNSWKYLGFISNRKLTFHQHIDFYSDRVISSIRYIKLLGNSSWGISPLQKRLLYRSCILPITLYGFQLWFYNHAPLSYSFKAFNKMQRRVAIWILGTFKTSPTEGIETLVGLIPIKSHITKLGGRSQLHTMSLPPNHIIWSLMDSPFSSDKHHHPSSLRCFTEWQKTKIKDHLIDANNRSYSVVSSSSPLYSEFSPGSRIIDTFSNWFSFNLSNKGKNDKNCLHQLDSIVIELSSTTSTAITIMDASIKNNITTAISHMHIPNRSLSKTHHHSVFVMSTEAELFTIRYNINQASSIDNISKIIVTTDSIHAARKIFNILPHPYQIHTTAILEDLCTFFSKNSINSIEFWKSPSCLNWHLYKTVDHESKSSNHTPIFPCKMSWDYSKKTEYDDIC